MGLCQRSTFRILPPSQSASSPRGPILRLVLGISAPSASLRTFLGQLFLTAVSGCFLFWLFPLMQGYFISDFLQQSPLILHPSFNYCTTSLLCEETSGKGNLFRHISRRSYFEPASASITANETILTKVTRDLPTAKYSRCQSVILSFTVVFGIVDHSLFKTL